MKLFLSGMLSLLVAAGTVCAADQPLELKNDEQKLSYAMGLDLGEYFKGLEEKFDLNVLQQGINDGYNGNKPLLSPADAAAIQQEFAKRQQEKQIQKTVAMVQKNRKAAEEFLKANKTNEGIVETKSGLQYKVIKKGQGAKLPANALHLRSGARGLLFCAVALDEHQGRPALLRAALQAGAHMRGQQIAH